MCAIFGSVDKSEFFELAKLNGYRGVHSHSIAYLKDGELTIVERGFGPISETDLPEADLYIGHQQAPTTDAKDVSAIHPAVVNKTTLWHNGIIKDYQVQEWKNRLNSNVTWDTQWLAFFLDKDGYQSLNEADGSFACLCFNYVLTLFRNENCPMFVKGTTFSSTKFEGSVSIQAGYVYQFFKNGWQITDTTFGTKETFFWSPD